MEYIYRKICFKEYEREDLLDKIIERNPHYVEECPLLTFFYNLDGSKIPLGKIIMRDREKPGNKADEILFKKLKKLDSKIIKNRRGTKTNIEKDIISLRQLSLCDDELPYINTLIEHLVNYLNASYFDIHDIYDIYDSIIDRISLIKDRINDTRTIAKNYSIKLYLLMKKYKL